MIYRFYKSCFSLRPVQEKVYGSVSGKSLQEFVKVVKVQKALAEVL